MDDVDMKKDDLSKGLHDDLNGSSRDRERDRRGGSGEKRDRSRDRERERRDSFRRRTDHWEPERRSKRRSRSRSPRKRSTSRRRSRRMSRSRSRSRSKGRDQFARSLGGPLNASPEEAAEMAKNSKRENRVYVGNLSYEVRYRDLMEFMRGAGEVLFAEVLTTPTGVSKGCGLVEFASYEDAQSAIRELSEVPLLGRPVFIREDRENEARFGSSGGGGSTTTSGNQLYIGNLPYQAGWQDIKDLFRKAGEVVRADINTSFDGRPKGSGTVLFATTQDAQSAIDMFHNYEWFGRVLEVREDRYAGLIGPGGRGGSRGGLRGGLRGGFRGGMRGSFRGGGMGGGEGRSFGSDIYADYNGPGSNGPPVGPAAFQSGGSTGGGAGRYVRGEPNQQIMVRNLPWSTANEDLVELFETTGSVEIAEILFDGSRSKGSGVVQFSQTTEAETAIAKFQNYMYGGRPLDVSFNDRWHTFTPSAARGGTVAPMTTDPTYAY